MTKFKIVLVDSNGTADSYAAGDPAPGRGVNEFVSREDALAAIKTLEPAGEGERWEVREAT